MSLITEESCTAVEDTEEVGNDAFKGNSDAIAKDFYQHQLVKIIVGKKKLIFFFYMYRCHTNVDEGLSKLVVMQGKFEDDSTTIKRWGNNSIPLQLEISRKLML